ncbi:MAG: ATP-dependent zinc metalloprotease FtsH [Bacteroidales bacterium]
MTGNTENNRNNRSNGKENGNKQPQFPRPKFSIYWVYAIILLAFFVWPFLTSYFGGSPRQVEIQRFENEMLRAGDVEKVIIQKYKEQAYIFIRQDKLKDAKYKDLESNGKLIVPKEGPHYFLKTLDVQGFYNRVVDLQKDVKNPALIEIDDSKDILREILGWILPIIIIIAIWMFIFRRMSGQVGGGGAGNIFNVGKSKAILFDKDSGVKIDFKDVAGLDEAKTEVREIVDFLKNPKKYTDLGAKIPKGVLLVGPPGTGKTLLAKAVAGEANVPFFSMSGSEFVEMFVGVGASRVRDLFRQAKEKAPCIVFIDEIDAIGRARGRNPNFGANDERENTLNQLLTEMDGFGTNSGVIIMAATNRADILDRALLRAGRFDRQIHVELPDLKERKEIFKVHLRPIKLDSKVDLDFLAKQTPGFSGADIANVCNEAALIAARKGKKAVEKQDFLDAVDRIVGGLERKNKIVTALEKKTIAYHEAGHATVSWLLEHASPLMKVTIIPRGRALGAAWYVPEERQITTREQMLDELCATLGGRASEELNFGKVSTGALNDLERVTKQAYAMVAYFGMSEKLGNLSYYDSTGQTEYSLTKPYSEKTAELIDEEAKRIVEDQYRRALKILNENKEGLKKLAELLLEKEVIFSEDLEQIFGPRKSADAEEQKLLIQQNNHQAETGAENPPAAVSEKPEETSEHDPGPAKDAGAMQGGNAQ